MREFGANFANDHPDNPYAQQFQVETRKIKSALADAKHYLRQALGLTALEARQGAQRELATHARALRPSVDAAE